MIMERDPLTKNVVGTTVLALLVACAVASAQQTATTGDAGRLDEEAAARVFPTERSYSPYAGRTFPMRSFFGETHLHTSLSFDAGMMGTRIGPEDAYRLAKGAEIVSSTGARVKLSRPLDFVVVADHSDNMGFAPDFFAGKPELLADQTGRH